MWNNASRHKYVIDIMKKIKESKDLFDSTGEGQERRRLSNIRIDDQQHFYN